MRNAWNDSDILKRVTIRRIEIARDEGRLIREIPLAGYLPNRTGDILAHMCDNDGGFYDFPEQFGMPRAFGRLIDSIYNYLDLDDARMFATDVLEVIQPGVDIVPAIWDVTAQMVRGHRGADNPAVAEAIKIVLRLAEPFCGDDPVKLRHNVASDAYFECQYRWRLIREKRGPKSPQMDWSDHAIRMAMALAEMMIWVHDVDGWEKAYYKFHGALLPRDYNEGCAAYLITALKRRRNSDGDNEPYLPRLPHDFTPVPA